MYRVGVIGARGYTGAELLRILDLHPQIEVTGRFEEFAGKPVPSIGGLIPRASVRRSGTAPSRRRVLALPDGPGDRGWTPYPRTRSSSTSPPITDSTIGSSLPELNRDKIAGARRIANPGCYATALQLSIAPFLDRLDGAPTVFGVSGYSGAGTTPSPRNDPANLRDNLIPYRLTGHNHERESTRQLGHTIRFMPHVHPAFRGLLVTAHMPLAETIEVGDAFRTLEKAYYEEPLVEVREGTPELKDGTGLTGVIIGGTTVSEDGVGLTVVAVEDNLLKGAAVQAVQNLNLALGLPEVSGIR
jgi:N-acetyl-gamma-glutamyl-phosphate reductase